MCNVTLSYNENSALARRKLAALLATGLFTKLPEPTADEEAEKEAHRKEVDSQFSQNKKSPCLVFMKQGDFCYCIDTISNQHSVSSWYSH